MTTDSFVTPPVCSNCGAKATQLDARYCAYCRNELPRLKYNADELAARSREDEIFRRFQELERHADLPRLKAFQPIDAGIAGTGTVLFSGIFLVMWVVIGGTVTVAFAVAAGPLALFPLALVCFGIFMMAKAGNKYRAFRNAPILSLPALIVDERVQVRGGSKNSSASTHYFTTLEYPGGQREEVETIPAAAADACPQDMGMAYLRAKTLVHFERIPV